MRTMRPSLAVVTALALGLAACGEDADDPPEATEPTDEVTGEPDEEAEEPADDEPADDPVDEAEEAEDDATIATAGTGLGEILVDGAGMTLYMFDPDERGPSTCQDDCAAIWPPLIDEDPRAGDGVDDALLGTVERDDGTTQVTYDGWPLYGWASDEEPGDTTGHGVEDVWWVLTPDGTPLRDAEAGGEDEEESPAY